MTLIFRGREMLEEGCIEVFIPNIDKFDGEIVSAEPVEIAGVKW